ncbi:MAG TPA: dethiobiotin synthase [Steroidobacteraceae bacterium]|nr:dethiobiotin synthase [Steroidobacteraceae bacterium]
MTGIFIAGTDTGVGKTYVGVLLVRALVRRGLKVAVMKPVAAGAVVTAAGLRNEDAVSLMAAANVDAAYELVNPYCLEAPASPHIAAADAGVVIDPARISRCFDALAQRADCVVVEGAGGWLAPISPTATMADLAAALRLPVLLVVGLRLGCLNHAQLTARAIGAAGLEIAAWVGNEIEADFARQAENLAYLSAALAPVPGGAIQAVEPLFTRLAERLIRAPDGRKHLS